LLQALPVADDTPWEHYRAERTADGVIGLLTLYQPGQEPDPAVQAALRAMDVDHVPRRLDSGRRRQRAFEVCEWIDGGDLSRLTIDPADGEQLRRLVDEIGRALDDFDRVGLRHRDLRPQVVLVRRLQPLDLVIDGFGSARLSEFDLDTVATLETTPYMAPELVAGGVSPASDWWSLGILLLEKLTGGRCFDGIGTQAFLIDALANGVVIPPELDPAPRQLLAGLLLRDRHRRWRWPQVRAWLDGEAPAVAADAPPAAAPVGPKLTLGGVGHHRLAGYALAAAEDANWDEAIDQLLGGRLIDWVRQGQNQSQHRDADGPAPDGPDLVPGLRRLATADLEPDWLLALSLKRLNPDLPAGLRIGLESAQRGLSDADSAQQAFNAALGLLAGPTGPDAPDADTSERQRELAQRLAGEASLTTLAAWLSGREQASSDDDRPQASERAEQALALFELETMAGQDPAAIAAFSERVARLADEPGGRRRAQLADSLVLELAAATRRRRRLDALVAEAEALTADLADLTPTATGAAIAAIDAADATAIDALEAVIQDLRGRVERQRAAVAAAARRRLVLDGMAELGYQVHEGMQTAWAEQGRIVLGKAGQGGYGIELGGGADAERLQLRSVAFGTDPARTAADDRAAETAWCGEVEELEAMAAAAGGELRVERARGIGEAPVKVVAAITAQGRQQQQQQQQRERRAPRQERQRSRPGD
jgi:hypothetical protein